MSLIQTEDDIKQFIRMKLGYGVVDVELTEEQLDFAIDQAKNWFAKVVGQLKGKYIDVVTRVYKMPDDCEFVSEVIIGSGSELSGAGELDGANVIPIGLTNSYSYGSAIEGAYSRKSWLSPLYSGHVWYSRIVEAYNRFETRKMFSSSGEWMYSQGDNAIIFSSSSVGKSAIALYLTRDIDLGILRQKEYMWVRLYALAEAFETLGYIRGKYSDLPSAGGGISLNGDTLLSNASEIKQTLEEEVKAYRGGHSVIVVG